jgi:hypothetical protein
VKQRSNAADDHHSQAHEIRLIGRLHSDIPGVAKLRRILGGKVRETRTRPPHDNCPTLDAIERRDFLHARQLADLGHGNPQGDRVAGTLNAENPSRHIKVLSKSDVSVPASG